ncbi:hypothetical protein CDO52_18495 [Nocardiopsis gilva YIM 90087]|uniref:Uncharacterized protein n=1 Tax=Nocardiopsis gilva YIM 90087 TaxID=1235441 RepID=A0A223SDS8_9ACTN|nr:hypothetical protein CDO52_18495 [Nocardiopsis gilva YIM 90087]
MGGALLAAVATAALTVWAWNAPLPDPTAHHVFLIVWALGGLTLAAELFARGASRLHTPVPRGVRVLVLGLLAGAALGTFPWNDAQVVFWYQLWWGGPVATALALTLISRSERSASSG